MEAALAGLVLRVVGWCQQFMESFLGVVRERANPTAATPSRCQHGPRGGPPLLSSLIPSLQFSSFSLPTNWNFLSSAFGINTEKVKKTLQQRKDCSNEAKPFPFTCNTSSVLSS